MGESPFGRWGRFGKYPGALLMVIGAAAGGYWLFVQTHLHQIDEFNNRELGHGVKVVQDTVDEVLKTAGKWKTGDSLCRFSRDQRYLAGNENLCKEAAGKTVQSANLQSSNGRLQIKFSLVGGPAQKPAGAALFDISFESILKELAFPESFELHFIADSKGRIVYDSSSGHLHPLRPRGWLNELIAGANVEPGPARRIGDFANLTDPAGHKIPLDQFKGGTTQLRIGLGGSSYHLYVQPLDFKLPLQDESGSGRWFLGGAVSSDEILRRSLAVDSYLLFALVFVVALGFLGWPFLKLLLIDARERFRVIDVYELIFSTVALVVLLVTLILGWDAYFRWRREADDTMKTLSEALTRNLAAEIKVAREQLEHYDRLAARRELKLSAHGQGLLGDALSYWPVRITWASSKGEPFLRAEPGMETDHRPQPNLAQRPYFQGIQAGERWSIEGSGGFVLQPGRSIVDGQFYSFLAIESQMSQPPSAGSAVALMSLKLRSVTEQPMPIGYSFAVVNREGHTLYANDPRRPLREDFVEEVEEHFLLSSALQGDRDQVLALTYRTKPHRFYLRPLRELTMSAPDTGTHGQPGWFIIVYRDLTGPRAIAARAIVLSLCYAIGGMLLLGFAAITVIRRVSGTRYGGRTGAWLWPHTGQSGSSRGMAIASAVLLLAGLATLAFFDGPILVVIAASFPLVAAGLWIARLFRGDDSDSRKVDRAEVRSGALWQRSACVLFVLCFAIPLAAGFLKFFWNDETGRLKYARALDTFECRRELVAAARREAHCPAAGCCARADSQIDYILQARKPDPPRRQSALAGRLSGWMPVQDKVVARIRETLPADLGRGAPGGGGLSANSLLLLPVLVFAWLWVEMHSRWILLAGVTQAVPPAPDFASWWNDADDARKRVMLQVAAERIANPRAGDLVKELVEEGALTFEPDLGPRAEWREELRKRLVSEAGKLREWEKPEGAAGWSYARWSVLLVFAAIAFFLVATQPDLPAELGALVSATTVAISTLRKGLDELAGSLKLDKPIAS